MTSPEHPVLELLRSRQKDGSLPGQRKDGAKVALVIEGGGMRGVISAGMVTALQYLGLRNVFDVVYGTSAGAINGAYFLSEQAPYGSTIYYDEINNSRFLSLSRAILGSPVMKLDFLLDDVMIRRKVLDWRAVICSDIPLKVIATSLSGPATVVLQNFKSRDELLRSLRASINIPFIAGRPISIENELLSDGGILEPIPFRSAIAAGCTHMLVLLTRRGAAVSGKPRYLDLQIGGRYLSKFGVDGKAVMRRRAKNYADDVKWLQETATQPTDPPFAYVVEPLESCPRIGRLEKKRTLLLAGAMSGMRSLLSNLGCERAQLIEVIAPFGTEGQLVSRRRKA